MEKRIFDFLDHNLTYEQSEEFLRDIGNDPEFAALYADIVSLRGLVSLRSKPGDIAEGRAGYYRFANEKKSRSVRRNIFRAARYVAAAVLAGAVAWLGVNNYRLVNPAPEDIAWNSVSVPAGQRVSVALNDGTIVWLNSMSTLTYPADFTRGGRTVRLRGEAYFEVAHNPENPFIVEGPTLDVRVLGTKFNLQDYADRPVATVSLVEGSVEVSEGDHFTRILSPNQRLRFENGLATVSEMENLDNLLWKEGIYAFEDLTLAQIAEILEVYYDVRILIENPALLQYKYSGKFRQQDGVYEILRILQQFYRFSIQRDDSTRTITIK